MIAKVQDDGDSGHPKAQTNTLLLNNCKCQHSNSVKVINLQNQQSYEFPLVTNKISQQSDNVVIKITEIRYLDKKYIVQDRYVFDHKPQSADQDDQSNSLLSPFHKQLKSDDFLPKQIKEQNKTKKVFFFQKRANHGEPQLKRNTKNLPKNFYKGFLSFLENYQSKQGNEEILRQVRGLCIDNKYNNILIQKMLSNAMVGPRFKQFLENHAEDWIRKSKISDKNIHIEAIPIYLQLVNRYCFAEGSQYWSYQ